MFEIVCKTPLFTKEKPGFLKEISGMKWIKITISQKIYSDDSFKIVILNIKNKSLCGIYDGSQQH